LNSNGAPNNSAHGRQLNIRRSRDFHPTAFFVGCGFNIALLTSWFLEPTRSIWLAVDEYVFWTLNNSLADGRAWQVFWAAANNRATDVVAGLLIIGLFAHFIRHTSRDKTSSVIAIFVMTVVLGILGSQIGKAMPVSRPSGTMVHASALRLSDLVTWMPTKDISGDSFPGDHTTVLLIFAGIVTFYLPRAYAVAAWAIAIVFTAPRIFGGAHWLTDDLVGSVAIAGLVLGCVLATPLQHTMINSLESLIGRIRNR